VEIDKPKVLLFSKEEEKGESNTPDVAGGRERGVDLRRGNLSSSLWRMKSLRGRSVVVEKESSLVFQEGKRSGDYNHRSEKARMTAD